MECVLRPAAGPALELDARPTFMFQCGASDRRAVMLDGSGAMLPKDRREAECVLRRTFPLGMREPLPAPLIPAEPRTR